MATRRCTNKIRDFLFVIVCIFSLPAQAEIYHIDLNSLTPIDNLQVAYFFEQGVSLAIWPPGEACVNCFEGPIYPVLPAQPGDVFNFGQVEIPSILFDPYLGLNFQGVALAIFRDSNDRVTYSDTSIFNSYVFGRIDATLGSSKTFQLEYTIPDGIVSISVAWDAPGIYTPPAVPELSTWAMLLLGFIVIGLERAARNLRLRGQ